MTPRGQAMYMHVAAALTALTGIVFAVMKYAMSTDDPFAAANHPWQPHMLSAHVVVAPLLLFGLGWMFGDHIWPRFRGGVKAHRGSGLWSMAMIAPMTLSAYLMQIATNDTLRETMKWIHLVTSAAFTVAYVVHLVKART